MKCKIIQKAIYLDMDGTIFDLYKVDNWLEKLRKGDVSPYIEAKPIVDLSRLAAVLDALKSKGYRTGIISWGSMGASKSYMKDIRIAKREAIAQIPHQFDELHIVKYGAPKHRLCNVFDGILVDDSEAICKTWEKSGGAVIQARDASWLDDLEKLIQLLFSFGDTQLNKWLISRE